MKRRFVITVDLPEGFPEDEFRNYVKEAVEVYSKQFNPAENPLTGWFTGGHPISVHKDMQLNRYQITNHTRAVLDISCKKLAFTLCDINDLNIGKAKEGIHNVKDSLYQLLHADKCEEVLKNAIY